MNDYRTAIENVMKVPGSRILKQSHAGLVLLFLTFVLASQADCRTCCSDGSANDFALNGAGELQSQIDFNLARTRSAQSLTGQALTLTRLNKSLDRLSELYLLALTKETPHEDFHDSDETQKGRVQENTEKTRVSAENFQKLMLAYQEARRRYLQHKLLYDEHIAAYHHQAQVSQSPQYQQRQPGQYLLQVPQLKNLRVTAQDACNILQQAEQGLIISETRISQMLMALAAEKGKIDPNVYFQNWTNAQSMGSALQNQVVDFGRNVLSKEQTSEDQLHDLTQAAQRDGSFNQSKYVYFQIQQRTALNNEETKRAQIHTAFSANALNMINSLGPLNAPPGAAASPPNPLDAPSPFSGSAPAASAVQSSQITADQLLSESQSLQNEYDTLQQQYAEVEKANPSHSAGGR